jgi:[acyl-carrier-protein] S-malonyltransferase
LTKKALLFPGQGAQQPGMGLDIYNEFSEARAVFDEAESVMGPGFIDIIFSDPDNRLGETSITQPAILTVSTAIQRILVANGINAEGAAGLSLGEYSALVAAGVISFRDALPLVAKRGKLMQQATPPGMGGMTAVMGLNHRQVKDICMEASKIGIVMPANFNCPGQIVISGENKALAAACKLASSAGAKRITPLKVSTPFHSTLLKPIEKKLAAELDQVPFSEPDMTVVFNIDAEPACHKEKIKNNLVQQVSNPILWEQSVIKLLHYGFNHFAAIGPGTSPARLMKRISPESKTVALDSARAINEYLESVKK